MGDFLEPCEYIISIHAPHARSDGQCRPLPGIQCDFNPRSSCEERLDDQSGCISSRGISIHAPHARSDWRWLPHRAKPPKFQSTLLMRGATVWVGKDQYMYPFQSTLLMRGATPRYGTPAHPLPISIHAPHARSDPTSSCRAGRSRHFNPRSSCEERRKRSRESMLLTDFNPRSSCEERPAR